LSALSRWIVDHVPGIAGNAGTRVRHGFGIGQIIQTPNDLSQAELIEDDLPYAGVLGLANSWTALSDERLNTFQLYLGVLGPASLAEEVQTFVHTDLGLGEDPMGWDNQLDNEPVINLNYAMARKLGRLGHRGGFSGDLAAGGSLGLGNLFSQIQAGLQTRFGWNLPEGFVHIPDMAGRGVIVNPVLEGPDAGATRFYFSAVVRAAAIGYTVLLDGNTFEDSHNVDYDHHMVQSIIGTHFNHGDFGLHFNLYLSANPADDSSQSDLTWGNVSLDYRF
jgi:hypothetical protein